MKIKLTEEIWKEGNMYVSYCPELDIASCGEAVEQARKNLKEVICINLEETQKLGTFKQFLQEAGFEENQDKVLSVRKELVGFTPIEIGI
jgi:predicted RNase H-like HicB family nuclease